MVTTCVTDSRLWLSLWLSEREITAERHLRTLIYSVGFWWHRTLIKEARIRRFAVGLLAIAALAAAGYLLTRRRPALAAIPGGKAKVSTRKPVEDLYAAGL
jgi:hypothetical protein